MAKRKRLTAEPGAPLETKAFPMGVAPVSPRRPPIAQVAGDAATLAAIEELAGEISTARRQGRMVMALPLDTIRSDHLVRDRMDLDTDEMEALKASLAARGQQTPVEVVEAGQGAYGLISGGRRLAALKALHAETGEARFAHIQALIKPIDTAQGAYLAMVEENEIRADLSFYERGRLASEAARIGIYDSPAAAVKALFANTTPSKRSKITAFVTLHNLLGESLRFPRAIPEKVGLALVKAAEADPGFARRLAAALRKAAPGDATAERRVLDAALRKPSTPRNTAAELRPGLRVQAGQGRVVLSGKAVTPDFVAALERWLSER